ncbi:hypothetical protein [Serratia marcescens]|uniref:hypothetical protein n=1 Tax=Serratia marcescens TaxID=615 RepID=UPI0027E5352C|nr:hypothetical protein [Serratia marcescens]WLS18610.1 hypothetical protein RAA91_21065 [Serratia marcescens]HCB1445082.1 hypothetical protein [Serratia marcescens]HCB1484233.1 hypothetical protein [Serratia marcescens]HCB1614378.1 hypothetical protein [Serratia marcescens]HCB1619623.1 hypothetical protein [Serratia marcescens]
MTLTTERQQFEEWFKFHSDEEECTNLLQRNSAGTNYLHPHTDLAWIAWKASRELLANREAQPVGYIDPDSLKEYRGQRAGGTWSAVQRTTSGLNMTTPIYTAPPAPAVPTLPTALLDAMDEVLRISDRDHEAWDKAKSAITACRAAMLAQPVSSSYTLPEGFKLMPLEMTDEIGEAIAMEARCCGGIALCIYEAALEAAPEGGNGA